MLEFDDIQHILLTRTPALTGRYEFLSFRSASGGRAWLNEILKTVQSAADVLDSVDEDKRWVTVAFTWNGLKALGVDETSLATFPEEFKQGMAPHEQKFSVTPARIILTTGWGDLPARISTPSPFYLPAMKPSGSVALQSTKGS